MPDTTPMPVAFKNESLAEALQTAAPVSVSDSEVAIDVILDESGSPTETLLAAPIRRPWSNLGRIFWRLLGVLAAGAIATVLLAH
jgi:hypothetical protein